MPCGARQNDLFLIIKKRGRFFPDEDTATFLNRYLVGENRPTQQRENTWAHHLLLLKETLCIGLILMFWTAQMQQPHTQTCAFDDRTWQCQTDLCSMHFYTLSTVLAFLHPLQTCVGGLSCRSVPRGQFEVTEKWTERYRSFKKCERSWMIWYFSPTPVDNN